MLINAPMSVPNDTSVQTVRHPVGAQVARPRGSWWLVVDPWFVTEQDRELVALLGWRCLSIRPSPDTAILEPVDMIVSGCDRDPLYRVRVRGRHDRSRRMVLILGRSSSSVDTSILAVLAVLAAG